MFFLSYITFMSVYGEIKFNKLKNERYKVVIENLKDIRDSQLAHRTVTGKFADNWDNLVKFIDTAEFTITQRRDTTVIDEELTKRYGGVETTKSIYLIDTLGTRSVKDSLFGVDTRYKTMMNIPLEIAEGAKFQLKAGKYEKNDVFYSVFEASVAKRLILSDQDTDLIYQEEQLVSVDGINGPTVRVGTMNDIDTGGNWPKLYDSPKQ